MFKGFDEKFAETAIKNVLKFNGEQVRSVKEIKQGTDSKVFLVNLKYIFKFHSEMVIRAEYEFFTLNKSPLDEEIVYVDNEFKFIVYKFIENDKSQIFDAKIVLGKLANYVNNYKSSSRAGYGFLFEECSSWGEFLKTELDDDKAVALKALSENDYQKVLDAVSLLEDFSFEKKLMHGDFGMHNLLFFNGKLAGVIDPQPMLGDPLYDFIFCAFSNSKIAKMVENLNIYEFVSNEPKIKVDAMIIYVLFGRIARCVKYKLSDLDYFVKLFKKKVSG